MSNREHRLVENEKTFRSANERLAEVVEPGEESVIPFLCECADDLCFGRVEVTGTKYREVRAHEDRFIIVAGHLQADGEHVVDTFGPYELVEKE